MPSPSSLSSLSSLLSLFAYINITRLRREAGLTSDLSIRRPHPLSSGRQCREQGGRGKGRPGGGGAAVAGGGPGAGGDGGGGGVAAPVSRARAGRGYMAPRRTAPLSPARELASVSAARGLRPERLAGASSPPPPAAPSSAPPAALLLARS